MIPETRVFLVIENMRLVRTETDEVPVVRIWLEQYFGSLFLVNSRLPFDKEHAADPDENVLRICYTIYKSKFLANSLNVVFVPAVEWVVHSGVVD